ncbi:hypothetical protein BDR07DRAFT_1430855 [Suillus spraguei]|nr:hypothetical protein BDR07DRAFT_1430855 [Suillus spraguei]
MASQTSIWRHEGFFGLWKGTILALIGVSNGAVRFIAYEEMNRCGFEQKQKRFATAGKVMGLEDDKLSNTSYTLMSGNNATSHLYPDIPTSIKRT